MSMAPASTAPEQLRRLLLQDLRNAALRRQYLAVRTPELRELDRLSVRLPTGWFVMIPVMGLVLGLFCGSMSWWNFGWILPKFDVSNPGWIYWFIGWAVLGCIGGCAMPFVRRAAAQELAGELGPLPPDTPDKLEEARAMLLGQEASPPQ